MIQSSHLSHSGSYSALSGSVYLQLTLSVFPWPLFQHFSFYLSLFVCLSAHTRPAGRPWVCLSVRLSPSFVFVRPTSPLHWALRSELSLSPPLPGSSSVCVDIPHKTTASLSPSLCATHCDLLCLCVGWIWLCGSQGGDWPFPEHWRK